LGFAFAKQTRLDQQRHRKGTGMFYTDQKHAATNQIGHSRLRLENQNQPVWFRLLFALVVIGCLSAFSISAYSASLDQDGTEQAIDAQTTTWHYISANGTDTSDCNGGTKNNPWKSWDKAQACAQPGSTVYFMAGTYSDFAGSSNKQIRFQGTSSYPIEIKPAPGAEGRVYFSRAIEIYGEHGVVSGIDINANSTTAIAVTTYGNNIVLVQNKIHGAKRYACVKIVRGANSVSVIENEVYDCGTDPNSTTNRGVALSTTANGTVFRGNQVHHAYGAIQVKGGATDILIENNRIYALPVTPNAMYNRSVIYGSGMGSDSDPNPELGNLDMHDPSVPIEERYQAKNVMIRNNLIYNTDGYAAIAAGGWVNYQIYNNTILNHSGNMVFYVTSEPWEFFDSTALDYCKTHSCYKCPYYSGSKTCVQIYLPSKNGEIRNNIVHTPQSRLLTIDQRNSTGFSSSNNLFYRPDLNNQTDDTFSLNGARYSLAEFKALGYEANSLMADPKLIDTSSIENPNLRLRETSPAINNGIQLQAVPQDFAGMPRLDHDIGAYEFGENMRVVYLPIITNKQVIASAPDPLTPNMQGYWTLDQENDPRLDHSGQENHLASHNTVQSVVGQVGLAAAFENGQTGYLFIDDAAQTGLDIAGNLTLVGWVNIDVLNQWQMMASKYDFGTNDRGYRFGISENNHLHLAVSPDGQYQSTYTLDGQATLAVNRWYHVAAVFDANAQTLTLYIDGSVDATRSVSYSTIYNSSAPFVLGANMHNNAAIQLLSGQLDEWRIYNRALSESEIKELMTTS
jgi:hypothetical protein